MYDAVGYVGVAAAVALETIVAPIPSEVILPMAGWKVSQSAADAVRPGAADRRGVELPAGGRLRHGRQPHRRARRLRDRRLGRAAAAGPLRQLRRHRRRRPRPGRSLVRALGIVGRLPRADGSAACGPSSATPPASPGCRLAASSSSARSARCLGTRRSDRRGIRRRRRTTRRSRRPLKPFEYLIYAVV